MKDAKPVFLQNFNLEATQLHSLLSDKEQDVCMMMNA
jgi:hypothetical protein